MTSPAYRYAAQIVRVHDGDTIMVNVSLGFDVILRGVNLRLAGCNARELTQPGGPEARNHLTTLLPANTQITVSTVRPDKYGSRYDATVTLPDGTDLVTQLVADGWAAPWDGAGPKPVPPWPRP